MMDARLAFVALLLLAGDSSGAAHVTITMSIDSVRPAPAPTSATTATTPVQI